MEDIQELTANPITKSPKNQTRIVFSWSQTIRDCLWIVFLTIFCGLVLNYSLLLHAFNGTLMAEIQQKQLVELRQKAKQLYPGISFIDLISAKKLYDDKIALFLDARTAPEYQREHIYGASSLPIRTLVLGNIELDSVLPDRLGANEGR